MMEYLGSAAVELGNSMTTTHCTFLSGCSSCGMKPPVLPVWKKTDKKTCPSSRDMVSPEPCPKAYLAWTSPSLLQNNCEDKT